MHPRAQVTDSCRACSGMPDGGSSVSSAGERLAIVDLGGPGRTGRVYADRDTGHGRHCPLSRARGRARGQRRRPLVPYTAAACARCRQLHAHDIGLDRAAKGRAAAGRRDRSLRSLGGEAGRTWAGRHDIGLRALNFDLCLLDIWATLAHGGQVLLVDQVRATNGTYLLDEMERHPVTTIQAVPMFYRLLAEATTRRAVRFDRVETVIFTGDAMPAPTLAALPRLFPHARLFNIYGCTETNDSFIAEIAAAEADLAHRISIGRPLLVSPRLWSIPSAV